MTRTDLAPVPVEQLDAAFVGLHAEVRVGSLVVVRGGISEVLVAVMPVPHVIAAFDGGAVMACLDADPHTHVWLGGRHVCLPHPAQSDMPWAVLYVARPTDPATGQPFAEETSDAQQRDRAEAPAPDAEPRAVRSGVAGADRLPDGPAPRTVGSAARTALDRARRVVGLAGDALRAAAMNAGPALAAIFAGFLMLWGVQIGLGNVPASGWTITAALLIAAGGGIATRLVSVARARHDRSAVTR